MISLFSCDHAAWKIAAVQPQSKKVVSQMQNTFETPPFFAYTS